MLCNWGAFRPNSGRRANLMDNASTAAAPGESCRNAIAPAPARRRRSRNRVTWKLFSCKDRVLWPFLHFLKYGLPYRVGLKRRICDGRDIKRINLLAVEHCANSCQHCSTSSPFAQRRSYPAAAFFPWLDTVVQCGIKFSQLAITGGEPFLHEDLGVLIKQLKVRYPDKVLGVTTNFFWANEQKIAELAPRLQGLDKLLISKYPNITKKLGGEARFEALVRVLRELCPQIEIAVSDGSYMIAWQLNPEKQHPNANCCTSDCYVLRADGQVSHCAVGAGIENRREYASIVINSKERLYDLRRGIEGFLTWARKYPFDLCFHCTLWRGHRVTWEREP